MADAASIINGAAAAKARAPRIQVKGIQRRPRDPYRTIRAVYVGIPPCLDYPKGAELLVPWRQVDAFLKKYPGSYVRREVLSKARRRRNFNHEMAAHLGDGRLHG